MREALEEIRNGMQCTEAAIRYGIPRSTLSDHKLGKVKPGVKSGPPPLLSTSEENDLCSFCCLLLILVTAILGVRF